MNRDSKGAPQTGTSPSPSGKQDSLADSAKKNATQLGDPVSLKAETSGTSPTEDDKGAGGQKKGSLAEAAMKNPSMLGDPVSLKAESADSEPTENDRGAAGTKKSKL